jgi:hypothetical protein
VQGLPPELGRVGEEIVEHEEGRQRHETSVGRWRAARKPGEWVK